MEQILVVGCSIVLALIVMDTNVVKTASGLDSEGWPSTRGGHASAAAPAPSR